MAIESNITQELGWHRFEHKYLDITVTDAAGDPVDLSAVDLRWLLLHHDVLLEKTSDVDGGIDVTGVDNNLARIEVEADDYDSIPAGVFRHELWDMTNELLLSFGTAWLNDGAEPPVVVP